MKKHIIITNQNSPYYCQDLHPYELISEGMVWCVVKDDEQEIEVGKNELEVLPTLCEAIKAREEGKEVYVWDSNCKWWAKYTSKTWIEGDIFSIVEPPKPRYVPYTFDDAPEIAALGFGVFDNSWHCVRVICPSGVYLGNLYFLYSRCLELVKKPDGTPFGKKVEP